MQVILSETETRDYLRQPKIIWPPLVAIDLEACRAVDITRTGEAMYKHPVDHKLLIAVAKPVDRYGNQAAIEGKPVFALSDSSYGELTPSEDGLIAVFVPNGTPTPEGVAVQVVVTADADLGEGRKEITSRGEFALVAGEAVGLVIGFSDGGAF